jgi:5'-3' exonuclease
MESFRGCAIPIDGGSWFFKMRVVARDRIIYSRDIFARPFNESEADEPWMHMIFDAIKEFIVNGITPVIVFDGEASHLKDGCKEERYAAKEPKRREISELLASKPIDVLRTDKVSLKKYQDLLADLTYVPPESSDLLRNFLSGIGIPTFHCMEEAERLCAALCREGMSAVFSPDGDTFAHHAPILLRNISKETMVKGNSHVRCFEMVEFNDVLRVLGVTPQQFTEACVLAGCDYNQGGRIKGVAFGVALKEIKKYGTLDTMSMYKDIKSINHRECGELFALKPSSEMIKVASPVQIRPWSEMTADCMRMYRMDSYISTLKSILERSVPHTPFIHRPMTPPLLVIEGEDEPYSTLLDAAIKPAGTGATKKTGWKRGGKTIAPPPYSFPTPPTNLPTTSSFLVIED